MIPVKNHLGLYRDEYTNAILDDNDSKYQDYINSKNKLIQNQKKLETIEKEIEEIKKLLHNIIENK
jgi:hypothetical protein